MDWSIARTIARLAAGGEGPAESGIDVVAFCAEMEPHVLEPGCRVSLSDQYDVAYEVTP